MDWPKITGYVGVTSSAISIVSQIAADIVPEDGTSAQLRDTLRWSKYLTAYVIFIISVYLTKLSHKSFPLYIGSLTALLCLSLRSEMGIGVGLIYFFWAYAKLDKLGPDKLPF